MQRATDARKAFEEQRKPTYRPLDERPGHQRSISPEPDEPEVLVCANCRTMITSDALRIEVNGRHDHTFMNAHGYAFHIGCFDSAPGVQLRDRPSTEWPWFPGYTWQIGVCTGCGIHLGWLFASPSEQFFGLVLARLQRAAPTHLPH